ncbi:g9602 [Coccomyxa elongata]
MIALYIDETDQSLVQRLALLDSSADATGKPEIKPSLEDLWKEYRANPKSFKDLRRKKEGNPKRPDFKQKESGLCLWLNTAPPWVYERLDNGDLEAVLNDGGSIPEKPRVEIGGAKLKEKRTPPEQEDIQWTEELINAVRAPLLGELADDATEEADPPQGSFKEGEMLLRHQRRALAWMLKREKSQPSGGILADDQGLGKTLTALALIVSDPQGPVRRLEEIQNIDQNADVLEAPPPPGGTLILCPKSTLRSTWLAEIRHRLASDWTVCVYAGKDRLAITPEDLAAFDIVLATPQTMRMDSTLKIEKSLHQVAWHRVIIDEAQSIKNHRSITSAAAALLQAEKRWLMSGTPLQNSLEELFSYFVFLSYQPFNSRAAFIGLMRESAVLKEGLPGLHRLRDLLAPIMLRRTKQSQIDGEPIVQLPGTKVCKVAVDFSATERAHYEKLAKETEEENGEHEGVGFLLSKLQRLQMACNHPSLQNSRAREHRGACDSSTWQCSLCGKPAAYRLPCSHLFCCDCQEGQEAEEVCQLCNRKGTREPLDASAVATELRHLLSAKLEYVRHLAQETAQQGKQMLVFSLWTATLDLLEPILESQDIPYCRLDGRMSEAVRTSNIASFCEDKGNTVFLISTLAGGTGLNLTAASKVVLVEPYWNPYIEAQAISRADRIGQTKVVEVYKLYVPGTVEERIFELQDWKSKVVDCIMGQSDLNSAANSKITKEEMQFLLGHRDSLDPSTAQTVSQRPQVL